MKWIPTPRDALFTGLALALTTLFCYFLWQRDTGESTHVPLLFVLCVLVVSRFTNGYACGIAAAVIAVLGVNYVFTYPYMAFNFTLAGYPLTFVTMLAVAFTISALTSHVKQQEIIKLENEREKMRSNLLRAISHDLRTPLTSIIGSVGAVIDRKELDEEKRNELLTDVRNDAEWLIRMVENLLSVTRIENDPAKIKKTPEAVEEVVSESVDKFKKRFHDVKIKVTVPDNVLFVPMDAVLIEQVISNLLENAVTHGKVTRNIELSVRADADRAVFSVADDGVGISSSIQPHLFTDYFDSSRRSFSHEKRNMGIGLSVCKTIIRAHGGTIAAENRQAGGASFTFTLPMEKPKIS